MAGQSGRVVDSIPPKNTSAETLAKGLLAENPVLRQMLGLCPTLAVSTAVTNGIGMGIATTFVLVCSGMAVSLLRNVIPSSVRIPAFITIIASFVTLVMMAVEAYLPALDEALGIYLPLIVVNCIVLGRAEVFASKHKVSHAALDGLGMGLGFTIALVLMSAIRELLGAGTLVGVQVMPDFFEPMLVMLTPAGGFAVLGVLIACSVWFEQRQTQATLAQSVGTASAEDTVRDAEDENNQSGQVAQSAESPCAACPMGCALASKGQEG